MSNKQWGSKAEAFENNETKMAAKHQLDYSRPDGCWPEVCQGWIVIAVFFVVWICCNLLLWLASHRDLDPWQGMAVLFFGAIALNAVFLIAGIAVSLWIQRTAGPVVFAAFLVVTVLFPGAVLVGALMLVIG